MWDPGWGARGPSSAAVGASPDIEAAQRARDGPARVLFNVIYLIAWPRAPTVARTWPMANFSRICMALQATSRGVEALIQIVTFSV